MKRVNNSSSRSVMALRYGGGRPVTPAEYLSFIPRIPNFVWLAMMILTVVALSISTLTRSLEQEREARASYSYTQDRVDRARGINRSLRERTVQIKSDRRVAVQVAQDQLHLVRANEVVVAVPKRN